MKDICCRNTVRVKLEERLLVNREKFVISAKVLVVDSPWLMCVHEMKRFVKFTLDIEF